MNVAVDLDDVVLEFFSGVIDAFYREFGEVVPWDGDPWGKDAVAFTTHPLLLRAGYKSWWDWLRARDWVWATFAAVPGAIGGIQTLREQGHYIECVTSKPDWAEHVVWKWLGRWRPPFNRVTITDSSKGQLKSDFTKADIIVDDRASTCEEFVELGREAILFQRGPVVPTTDSRIIVAHDWSQVVTAVRRVNTGGAHV